MLTSHCLLFLTLLLPILGQTFQTFTDHLTQKRRLSEPGIEGTSGKLFEGKEINKFNGSVLFATVSEESLKALTKDGKTPFALLNSTKCSFWSVVTTINPPTDAVTRQSMLANWCMVVVGDRKGPHSYELPNATSWTVFLDAKQQEEFLGQHPLAQLLPWNHFGRKNVGFLFAILHGASAVYDFDDDNMLISPKGSILVPGNQHTSTPAENSADRPHRLFHAEIPASYNFSVLNPYPLLGGTVSQSWPRGYPLDVIKATHFDHSNPLPMKKVAIPAENVGVIQYLANHDPDVDAIYRLTQPLPLDFPVRGRLPILMPEKNAMGSQVFCPYNAQTTLHMKSALWTLLLPVTVHGRVSDIWRSYFAQRLMADIGIVVVFHSPIVVQYRNSHNYLADFDSEGPLYLRSGRLVEQLTDWYSCAPTLPGRIEALWIMLYERGYIGLKDVSLVQAWLQALVDVHYQFPVIKRHHPSCAKQP